MGHRKKDPDDCDPKPRNATLFQYDPVSSAQSGNGKPTEASQETYADGKRPRNDTRANPAQIPGPRVYEVGELTFFIRKLLEGNPVLRDCWVKGEVSNLSVAASGHAYFSLKDPTAIVNCVMWRDIVSGLRFRLGDGLKLLVHGEISVYPPRGSYSLKILEARPEGLGALFLAFEQLKKKLDAEGLFDPALKRKLPALPSIVGVVTSPTGAVLQDIRNILFGRFPNAHLLVAPVRVQGEGAAREIVSAIELLNSLEEGAPDVIIVARGGGSLEDLWTFNEEVVARAIRASRIPVVSAVGHETDYTIADFVADARAPTPSKAAEMVMPNKAELDQRIRMLAQGLRRELRGRFDNSRLRSDELGKRLALAMTNVFCSRRERVIRLTHVLDAMSPMQVLGRGYSITIRQSDGRAVRDPATLEEGELLRTLLAKGDVVSAVRLVNSKKEGMICPPKPEKRRQKRK